jgi:Icc-related predicted phosphoesterase
MVFFVSDLHGKIERWEKLFQQIELYQPELVFIGGDILPRVPQFHKGIFYHDFIIDYLKKRLFDLRIKLNSFYPAIYLILGNDDPRSEESKIVQLADESKLFFYAHERKYEFQGFTIYGYSYIPPTPFLLKDWEKFDVSHYLDVAAISPLDGFRTVQVNANDIDYYTIQKDLQELEFKFDFSKTIFLFHSPPYKTKLDRAALDSKKYDHASLDVHVGSIAIKRFIEKMQPYLTLHGHIHESTRLTGEWQEKIGKSYSFNAATEMTELAIISFPLSQPELAKRVLL